MRLGLYLFFLLVSAGCDLRKKRVPVWIYVVAAIVAIIWATASVLVFQQNYQVAEHLASVGVGALLLLISVISRGSIGAGDGCFFIIAGLFLKFWEVMMVLCYSTLLCGLYGLGYYVWKFIHGGGCVGKETIPFLPFVIVPSVWMGISEVMQHGR